MGGRLTVSLSCLVLSAAAFTVACGDDDNSNPSGGTGGTGAEGGQGGSGTGGSDTGGSGTGGAGTGGAGTGGAGNGLPVVTWETPADGSKLAASTTTGADILPDADPGTPGWQGNLKVCTDIDAAENPDATVQFAVDGTNVGDPVTIDAEGCAELEDVTVPEGALVELSATTSEVGEGVGVGTISVPVDVTGPDAVAAVTAEVKERRATSFELSWDAPADNTGLSSYQVRVSKTPIVDQADYDAATSVDYTGTPAAEGDPDGTDVGGQLIETGYYFAIAPVDSAGNVGPFTATADAVQAEFLTVSLAVPGGKTNFGSPVDGFGDLNGDGFSDVVAGSLSGGEVRIYFGSASGPSATPDTVINGVDGFGNGVAAVDLVGDGKLELVVGSWDDNAAYIFAGRTTWPATLAPSDAVTTVTMDTTAEPELAGGSLGFAVARLGDFNGDGRDDVAIGAPDVEGGRGLVAVLLGKEAGYGAEVSLPDAFGTDAIRFDGEPGTTAGFGFTLLGLGTFYSGTRTDLIVSAPGDDYPKGAAFAFKGRAVTGTAIGAAAADNTLLGTSDEVIGDFGFAALGNSASGQPVIGLPLGDATPTGQVKLMSGEPGTGPFATALGFLETAEPGAPIGAIGRSLTGGGFSGGGITVSFIGDDKPDLVVPSRAAASRQLFILSAATVDALGSSSALVEDVADVAYTLPLPWVDFGRNVSALRDVNDDGYGDIAVTDVSYTAQQTDGQILVLY